MSTGAPFSVCDWQVENSRLVAKSGCTTRPISPLSPRAKTSERSIETLVAVPPRTSCRRPTRSGTSTAPSRPAPSGRKPTSHGCSSPPTTVSTRRAGTPGAGSPLGAPATVVVAAAVAGEAVAGEELPEPQPVARASTTPRAARAGGRGCGGLVITPECAATRDRPPRGCPAPPRRPPPPRRQRGRGGRARNRGEARHGDPRRHPVGHRRELQHLHGPAPGEHHYREQPGPGAGRSSHGVPSTIIFRAASPSPGPSPSADQRADPGPGPPPARRGCAPGSGPARLCGQLRSHKSSNTKRPHADR